MNIIFISRINEACRCSQVLEKMKTRLLIISGIIGTVGFSSIITTEYLAYGMCVSGTDWDKVPCWGRICSGDEPACTDPNWWKERWEPYYDYKGAEWMHQKKIELLDAIKTNTLTEWKSLTPNGTNSNVYDYYFYMSQVPSIYGVYVDQFFADSFPPLKQIKAGMKLDELFCKSNFVLLLKHDGSPACVKPETKIKLIERGWATADQLENKIITPKDNDKLINIKKGESFIVKLDSGYDWRIDIDNKTVVDSDYSDIRYSGSQGVYMALNSGQAIITGIGDPLCLSLDPPCMSPSILFQLNINVK